MIPRTLKETRGEDSLIKGTGLARESSGHRYLAFANFNLSSLFLSA